MGQVSAWQKAGIISRVAGRQLGQSRWLRAGWSAGRITLQHFGRVLHLLWLQIAGVFFLFFALAGSVACWREYHAWVAGRIGPGRALLAFCFALLFAWYGVSSFWRAGKKAVRR